MKLRDFLPTVSPLKLDAISVRKGTSAGVWIMALIPMACSSGLYFNYAHCNPTPRLLSLLAFEVGICGLFLYIQICQNINRSGPLLLKICTYPYLPCILTTVAISLLTDIHPMAALPLSLMCAYVMFRTTHWLFDTFPGSFSLGEGAVTGQTVALALTCSIHRVSETIAFKSTLSHSEQISTLIQVGVIVVCGLLRGIYLIPRLRSAPIFLLYFLVWGAVGIGFSSLAMKEFVVLWLFNTLTESDMRIQLFGYWIMLAIIALILTTWGRRSDCLAVTVRRKEYHIIIVLIFVPGILLDPTFIHLAAAGNTLFAILVEVLRAEEIEPISSIVSSAFNPFLDEKDSGTLILSHIYLLIGVSSPLWLTPCSLIDAGLDNWPVESRSILPLLSGVLSVGIGDTFASIGGTYLGRWRWAGTKKTIEGSACAMISIIIAVLSLQLAGVVAMTIPSWGRLLVATVFVSALEALTDQVDNIVLPLLFYTALMDL